MHNFINKIHNCDNMDLIAKLPNNSVSALITDVPYGLQDIDALKLIKENANNTRGFMNCQWDVIPTTKMLTEFNRVLKDGGFFVTTFTARQDLQCVLQYRLLEAGFDISFSSIIWNYQTGFPKAANFSKISQKRSGVDFEDCGEYEHFGRQNRTKQPNGNPFDREQTETKQRILKPTTDEAKYMEGLYSCQLKPAYEPIIIAQKRYKEKSKIDHITTWYNERKALLDSGIAEEDLSLYTKNSSGAISIDLARIPIENENDKWNYPNGAGGVYSHEYQKNNSNAKQWNSFSTEKDNKPIEANQNGRFPATILVSNNAMDVLRTTKSGKMDSSNTRHTDGSPNDIYGKFNINHPLGTTPADQGDLSRYFSLDAWVKKNQPELYKLSQKALELQHDTEIIYPFLNTSKPSQAEANAGLDSFDKGEAPASARSQPAEGRQNALGKPRANTHCTKKPISLFSYLITLFSSKENDIILDPFCGSGATCIASVLTNRKYIGIDMSKEYCDITEARVKYWQDLKNAKVDSEPEVDKQIDLF